MSPQSRFTRYVVFHTVCIKIRRHQSISVVILFRVVFLLIVKEIRMKSQNVLRLCYSTVRHNPAVCSGAVTSFQVCFLSVHLFVSNGTNVFMLQSRRWISLHEYQSKKLLHENQLNVQRFQVVENPQEAKRAGEELSESLGNVTTIATGECFSENNRQGIGHQSSDLSWWPW